MHRCWLLPARCALLTPADVPGTVHRPAPGRLSGPVARQRNRESCNLEIGAGRAIFRLRMTDFQFTRFLRSPRHIITTDCSDTMDYNTFSARATVNNSREFAETRHA